MIRKKQIENLEIKVNSLMECIKIQNEWIGNIQNALNIGYKNDGTYTTHKEFKNNLKK